MIRDSGGDVLLAGAKALGLDISIIQAEAWAIIKGIRGFLSLSISHLIIEGDNLEVINYMHNSWQIPWKISNIVVDAGVDIRKLFQECSFFHCFRETNWAADFKARKAHDYYSMLY